MNNWTTHLAQEVACWAQRMSRGEMKKSLPFDGMGWAKETRVLEESEQRTGNAVVLHRVPYLMGVLGNGRCEVGLEEAEAEAGDREHLEDVHDGWKMWEERGQEVDLDPRGFGIKQTLSGLSLSPCL